MKNITIQVFITLGVIFFILIILGTIFFVTDPYGLKPMIFGGSASTQQMSSDTASGSSGDTDDTGATTGFELSNAQMDALVSLGIDPADVPSSISAEQEACFVGVLGEERVGEIKAGAVPSGFEFMKAKSCI